MKLPAASGRGIKNHNKYLHEHDAFIGLFSKTSDPLFVEATGKAGFDFHPKGLRGRCRYVRPAAFSLMEKEQYIQSQNDVTVIIQVEGVEGIKNFNAILEVEDLDIIFIGPYDLSQSMGIPGQVDHPDLLNEIEKLVNQCNDKGRFTGIFTDDIPTAMKYRELGVKYIAYSVDVGIFAQACKSAVDRFVE